MNKIKIYISCLSSYIINIILMEDNFKDQPLQLVTIKEDGDFEITVEGINFLSALKNRKVNLEIFYFTYLQLTKIKFKFYLAIYPIYHWTI
jgi:hypothetical protein